MTLSVYIINLHVRMIDKIACHISFVKQILFAGIKVSNFFLGLVTLLLTDLCYIAEKRLQVYGLLKMAVEIFAKTL